MKQYVTSTAILATLALGRLPSAFAAECNASTSVTCTIKDTRVEFKDFLDKPCKEFETNYKIERNGSLSGYNIDGYPQIKVEYKYKICNDNDEMKKKIRLTKSETFSMVDDEKVDGLNDGGNMEGGKCRNNVVTTRIDSGTRIHSATAQISGFLFKGGKLFDGNQNPLVQCLANTKYQSRLEYDDDCDVQVKAQCFLKDTIDECEGRILRESDNDCDDVEVQYKFQICNYEDTVVKLKDGPSKIKINGVVKQKVKKNLPSQQCYEVTHDDTIKKCDTEMNTSGISVNVKGKGKFGGCRDYSFQSIEVGDAYPTASPSTSPSVSFQPSESPSISHEPSLSSKPSALPTKTPSTNPTIAPSSSPSESPTKSMKPSSLPTASPTTSPSSKPSATPTNKPSLSSAPSDKPSATPSLSMMPSCVPSAQPSESSAPSQKPTALPSFAPSDVPTGTPSESLAPSFAPSDVPTGTPSESQMPSAPPIAPTVRLLKSKGAKSSKKGKVGKSSKSKKSLRTFNICQD